MTTSDFWRSDWSSAMVDKSISHGNDVMLPTCDGDYKPKPHDNSNIELCKREANHILDKLHTITEQITEYDDSLFTEGGKLKTGLTCLHNFNSEKRHYIKSGVEKDVLHLVEDLDRVMAKYKTTNQIETKSTTSEARKKKEQSKKGKGEARSL